MYQLSDRAIRAVSAGSADENAENIRSALKRGLTELSCPAPFAHDGTLVIVGSGPSVTQFLEQIRTERRDGKPICAIKGTHDWLIENGIQPDVFVSVEPRERPLKYVSDTCCYLLASRCNQTLFDQVQGKNVVLWHSFASKADAPSLDGTESADWSDLSPEDECEAFKGHFCVGGGSTSGLRALTLAYILGYRKVTMYGMDSCLAEDKKIKRFTGEDVGNGKVIDVIVGGKRFWCNGALAKQANEFQPILNHLIGMKVDVKGDGLLAAIMEQRRLRGFQ